MKGSLVNNLSFDPLKQKIVNCKACNGELIVGKFAKNDQKCDNCNNITNKKIKKKIKKYDQVSLKKIEPESAKQKQFSTKFIDIVNKLGFTVNEKRIYRKKYAGVNGSVATIHIMTDPGSISMEPRVEYLSLIVQQAISLEENIRNNVLLPSDAIADCEVIASEFARTTKFESKIGQRQCDNCGKYTDEFGINDIRGLVLCIRPNNCFKKQFTSMGAESEI